MTYIYIYGAGGNGIRLFNRIEEYYETEVNVICFIDQYKIGQIRDTKIVPVDCVYDRKIPVIISVDNRYTISDIYAELKANGFEKIYFYLNRNSPRYGKDSFFDYEVVIIESDVCSIIPHIETHAVDYCNLNCKACIHFSPLYNKNDFEAEVIYSDIQELYLFSKGVLSLYIMGGEPLLRPDLSTVISEARKMFPNTDIQVLTNGLLISESLVELWKSMRDNNITLTISEYKPMLRKRKRIKEILENNEVAYIYRMYDTKKKFVKTISESRNPSFEKTCICMGCVNLYKGKVSRCPAVMYIDRLNEVFSTSFPVEGVYELSSFKSVKEFNNVMQQDIPLCEYCVKYEIEWDQCEWPREKADFMVVE